MALDNINLLSSSALSPNSDKILLYRSGGLEASTTLLSLTNSALTLSGVYLDPVNQRVGIGTSAPTTSLTIYGGSDTLGITGPVNQAKSIQIARYNSSDPLNHYIGDDGGAFFGSGLTISASGSNSQLYLQVASSGRNVNIGTAGQTLLSKDMGARLGVRGSGSTSATTSLLVQNSNALTNLQVTDDGQVSVINEGKFNVVRYGNTLLSTGQATSSLSTYNSSVTVTNTYVAFNTLGNFGWSFLQDLFQGYHPMIIQDATYKARETSALVELNSKTRGFLKPKMTTAQKNAIASPTAGLEVYDTDLNRPCFFNGTSWITL